jgi:hypothetical protein
MKRMHMLYALLGISVLLTVSERAVSQELRTQEFQTRATACNTFSNKDLTLSFAAADNMYTYTNLAPNNYGVGVITSVADAPTQVIYKFCVSTVASRYKMSIKYATLNERRGVNIDLNGTSLGNDVLSFPRQGWDLNSQQWESIGYVSLKAGSSFETANTLTVTRPKAFPHISQIMFEPVP